MLFWKQQQKGSSLWGLPEQKSFPWIVLLLKLPWKFLDGRMIKYPKKQDPEFLLMLTPEFIVFPISFCLEKWTYNDVLIAIYYYASYCFIFLKACGCLPGLKVILWIKCTGEKRPVWVLVQISCTVLLFSNWGCHKDHSSSNRSPSSAASQICSNLLLWLHLLKGMDLSSGGVAR